MEEELNEKIEKAEKDEIAFKKDLERHLEKIAVETETLREKKAPLERNMLEKQEIVNRKASALSEANHALATFTEGYDRAKLELDKIEFNLKTSNSEIDEIKDELRWVSILESYKL